MTGRRVRCRSCGTVFPLVPHEGAAPAAPGDSHAGAHATVRMDADDLARETGLLDTAAEPTPPDYEGLLATAPETPDAVFQDAFQDFKPPTRPNYAYKFPTATELDRWLPIVLPVVGLVWLTLETLGTGAATPGWVGPLRLVLFVGLFAGLVWPITLWAVRLAAQQLKFDLPPLPKYRVLAAFAVPFALTFILWQSAQEISGLVTGSIVGLVLGLATVWLLLRITPDEAPKTLGFSGAAFVGTIALSAGLLAGVNAIALAAAKDSKSPTTLASSPIVPGLPWVQPAPPDSHPRPKERLTPLENVAGADSTGSNPVDVSPPARTPPATTGPAVAVGPEPVIPNQPLIHPDPAASPGTPVAPAGTDAASDPATAVKPGPTTAPRNGSILFNEDPSRSPRRPVVGPGATAPGAPGPTVTAPAPVGPNQLPRPGGGNVPSPGSPATPDATAAGTPPIPGVNAAQPDVFITAISEARSPLVAEVAPVTTGAKLVGMAPPLAASGSVLLMEAGPAEKQEQLEVWSVSSPPKLRFQRPPFPQTQDRAYVVSPEGSQSARIVQFPNLSIEVWANDKGVSSKLIPMQQQNGKPVLLGFLGEDKLLVWWESGMEAGLEPYDIRTGQHLRPILLPVHGRTPGNGAASPDGKAFAVVLKDKDKPRVALYTLAANSGMRSFILPAMNVQMADPVAMSFSADGKKLAILFEQNGDAVLYDIHLAESKPPIGPILLPAGTLPAGPQQQRHQAVLPSDVNLDPACPHPASAREMSWLPDGASLLIRGDTVIDADTGQVKGRLGAKDVLSQVVSGNTCLLTYRENGDLRLARVTLRVPGAAPAPQPAHPAAAPAPAPGRSAATRPAGASASTPNAVPAGARAVPAAGPAPRPR